MDTEVRQTHRWRELDSNHRSRLFEVAFQRRRRERFVADSSLEGDGFELPVPREIAYGFGGFGPFSVAFGSPVGRDPSPKGTHPLATRN